MATITIKCVDAQTRLQIRNGEFELYEYPGGSKRHATGEEIEPLKNTGGTLIYRNLRPSTYCLIERKPPVSAIQIEDENCDFYIKRQTYVPKEQIMFKVEQEDLDLSIKYEQQETQYIEPEGKKTSSGKRAYNWKQRKALFERSHELNNKEFATLLKGILIVSIPVTIIAIILGLLLIAPLHFTPKATASFVLGLLALAIIVTYIDVEKYSTPRNRVLDKIPKPIKKGPNVGLYGTNEIVTDRALIKKILSTSNKLNEIELGDPGVYCGYYQPSVILRSWNVFADWLELKTGKKLRRFNGYYCYIPDDCHVIIYGDTRAGKTRRVLLSTIHLVSRGKNESFFIFDSKRELLALTSDRLRREGYDIKVYDFEHPENSTRHNPLYVAINLVKQGEIDKAHTEVENRILAFISQEEMQSKSRFFIMGAKALLEAVTMAVLCDTDCPEDQKTFTTVSRIIEKYIVKRPVNPAKPQGAKYSPFEEYMRLKFSYDHVVRSCYAEVIHTKDEYLSDFVTTAQQTIAIFRDPAVADMTRITENPFRNIAKKKQAVFIIAPATCEAYQTLATMFLDQMYAEIRAEAHEDKLVDGVHQVGRTTRRVNMMGEEILSIKPWDKMGNALNESAGMGIRFFLIIQNQALFNEVYSKGMAEGIKPNCVNQMLITTGDPKETVSHWSSMIGTMTVEKVSKVVSGSRLSPFKTNTSITRDACSRECLTQAEIQGWDANCGILVKTKLHENVINVPLPDVSCTPTEGYFQLGTKRDNLEKASKILRESFKDESFQKSKTNWLPGLKDTYNRGYSDVQLEKTLTYLEQSYKQAYLKRINVKGDSENAYYGGFLFNDKTGEIKPFDNVDALEKEILTMKYSAKDGWKQKKFKSKQQMNDELWNFRRQYEVKINKKNNDEVF